MTIRESYSPLKFVSKNHQEILLLTGGYGSKSEQKPKQNLPHRPPVAKYLLYSIISPCFHCGCQSIPFILSNGKGSPLNSHNPHNSTDCSFKEIQINSRMKFRSEISDNMDSWKSSGGKSQRGEAKK